MNRIGVVLSFAVSTLALAGAAHAGPGKFVIYPPDLSGHGDAIQVLPNDNPTSSAQISSIIFINRCTGGCTITSSDTNSSIAQESTIPTAPIGTKINIAAWPYDDQTWQTLMQCVREVYSPYNVTITDVDPGPTVPHHECIVAGAAHDVGLDDRQVGGVSPVSVDRTPVDNNISFVFAELWPASEVLTMCAAVGQESGHSFGLPDHEYSCTDPMGAGYHLDCGGQRFFRNVDSACGVGPAPDQDCNCSGGCASGGPTQNSHAKLYGLFGPGTSLVPAPTMSIVSPKNNDKVVNGWTTFVGSTTKRGTYRLKMTINGYQWATKDISDLPPGGVDQGGTAPIYNGTFQINAPADVPDGVMDLKLEACDDLDQCNSQTITVTKGNPCTDATQCAKGQKCDAGKCYWDPPTGMVGDPCTYQQACLSDVCIAAGAGGEQICSQTCFQHIDGQCPAGFTCTLDQTGQGYCFQDAPPDSCCSAGHSDGLQLAGKGGVGLLIVAVAFRRRRRRS